MNVSCSVFVVSLPRERGVPWGQDLGVCLLTFEFPASSQRPPEEAAAHDER